MAYDEKLAERVRGAVAKRSRIEEKRMFGGLAFLLGGRMFCGVLDDDLMVRVGPARYAAALSRPNVRPMDFTGRPITGFVYVGARGVKTAASVAKWVREAVDYALTLPRGKRAAAKRPRAKRASVRPRRRL